MARSTGSEMLVIGFSFLLCGGLLFMALVVIDGGGITANAVRESIVSSVQAYPAIYLVVLIAAALMFSSIRAKNSHGSF